MCVVGGGGGRGGGGDNFITKVDVVLFFSDILSRYD